MTTVDLDKKTPETKKVSVINPFVVMTIIILLTILLSHFVPAGEYERVIDDATSRTVVVPGSYKQVEGKSLGLEELFLAVPTGMINGAAIIFFIFISGGAIRIIDDLGTINAGLLVLIRKFQGSEIYIIPIIMFSLSMLAAMGTIPNILLALLPIGIVVARQLKFDPVVGMSMIYLGMIAGFNTGPLVLPTVGISHQIGEMTIFSGAGIRSIVCLAIVLTTIAYVCLYAKKVKKNPAASLVADLNLHYDFSINIEDSRELSKRDWLIFGVVILSMALLVYGSLIYNWGFIQISALFFGMGIVSGFFGGFGVNKIADSFVKGMAGITSGAMITGFAYAIQHLLKKSQIIDTIIYYISDGIVDLPVYMAAVGMFLSNIVLNLFITSGSGQAVTVMPIMFPIADLAGLSRQVAVQAFQFGDGFSNGIVPTSGVLMASLSIAKIPYFRWAKFYIPLMFWWSVIAVATLILASIYQWH